LLIIINPIAVLNCTPRYSSGRNKKGERPDLATQRSHTHPQFASWVSIIPELLYTSTTHGHHKVSCLTKDLRGGNSPTYLLINYCRRVCVVVNVFDIFVYALYLEKRKNMCKYFSGCGYTVGSLNWQKTGKQIILTVCLAYICTIFFLSLKFFLYDFYDTLFRGSYPIYKQLWAENLFPNNSDSPYINPWSAISVNQAAKSFPLRRSISRSPHQTDGVNIQADIVNIGVPSEPWVR